MIEIWKPIKNWEKFYEVSNLGNVRNIKTNRLLTGDINNCGYYRVCLYHKNKKKRYFRHRLVAEHFIFNDDIENKTQVNHIDGNKLNNTVFNLEWITPSENDKHAFKTGLKDVSHNKPFIAEFDNGTIEEFKSLNGLSKKINISYANISLWLNGKLNTYKNYGIKKIYYK